jgi:predicted transcriptional regulator
MIQKKAKKKLTGFGAKLTPAQVRWARKVYSKGQFTQNEIAAKLEVTQPAVSMMLYRKTYRKIA